jgi:hypothetical protein
MKIDYSWETNLSKTCRELLQTMDESEICYETWFRCLKKAQIWLNHAWAYSNPEKSLFRDCTCDFRFQSRLGLLKSGKIALPKLYVRPSRSSRALETTRYICSTEKGEYSHAPWSPRRSVELALRFRPPLHKILLHTLTCPVDKGEYSHTPRSAVEISPYVTTLTYYLSYSRRKTKHTAKLKQIKSHECVRDEEKRRIAMLSQTNVINTNH